MKKIVLFVVFLCMIGLAQDKNIRVPLNTIQLSASPIQLSDGASIDIYTDSSNTFYVTLSENCEFNIINMKEGQIINIWITNVTYTATWTPTITWRTGTAPVLTENSTDVVTIEKVNGIYYGNFAQDFH